MSGSREFKDKNRLYHEVNELRKQYKIVLIISGEAPGADTFAKNYADDYKIKYKGFPAEWDDMEEPCVRKVNSKGKAYNASAGFKRNTTIVNECTHLLAFWVKKSPGTRDSVLKAKQLKKVVKVIDLF